MEKISILLVCSAGMSTSIVVDKMKEYAKEINLECEIKAQPITELAQYVDSVDVCLLAPQVRFQADSVKELVGDKLPVEIIDMMQYGICDGESILKQALKAIEG